MGNVIEMSRYRRVSVDVPVDVSDEVWFQLEEIAFQRGMTVSELVTEHAIKMVEDSERGNSNG